jgi:plastocyanin
MRTYRLLRIALSAALLAVLGWAASSSGKILAPATQTQPSAAAVKIDNFSFGPPELTVAPGTKVTWTNRDDIPHTVKSTNELFKSKALDTDDQFSFTFDTPGTYEYFCSIHPKMTGRVVVK